MPEFLHPFGPFHMVMLHLPIGALAAIWFLEVLLENNGDKHQSPAIGLLHLFLALSSGITIALGLAYTEYGSYGDEIDAHELWGYLFGGGVLLSCLLYWIHRGFGESITRMIYLLALFATTIAMIIAGHLGAELIHGKGFLSKPFKTEERRTVSAPVTNTQNPATPQPRTLAPQPTPEPRAPIASSEPMNQDPMALITEMAPTEAEAMNPMAAAPPALSSPPSDLQSPQVALFEAAQDVFQRHCINCHGATKQKGDYRMDSQHSIRLGGKSELPAIVPGDIEESELMYRMLLPRDDDDVMPPENKAPVSAEDIDSVRQWIKEGAYWPNDSELTASPREYIKAGDANTDELIQQISTTGVKAEYNAWGDQSVRIDLGVVAPGQLKTAINQLNQFEDKLTWLDCSDLELSQSFYKEVQQLKHIERLHLDGTNVTDEQLKALSQLPKLSYLNLYNTQISDEGLAALQSYPALEKVFLSQTQVSQEGIKQLKKANPALNVVYQP